ncbi:MAG: FkbM family methyltransferase [Saprospiraceae bacterium]
MSDNKLEYGYLNNITVRTKVLNFIRQIFFIKSLENWLVSKTKDKTHGGFYSKLVPNHYQYPKNTERIATRNGVRYHFDLSDLVDWWTYYGFEDKSKTELYASISDGSIVMDIGANMGDVSFNLARIIGNKGHVISFEPDRSNYERFERNLALNNFSNITLVKNGLGREFGSFTMAINENEPGNDGSKRILKTSNNSKNLELVKIITLDSWVEKNPIEQLDLVKIDVEGYEVKALKGGENTLVKYGPDLYMEVHDAKLKEQGSSAKELLFFIQGLGYSIQLDHTNSKLDVDGNLNDIHIDVVCKIINKETNHGDA